MTKAEVISLTVSVFALAASIVALVNSLSSRDEQWRYQIISELVDQNHQLNQSIQLYRCLQDELGVDGNDSSEKPIDAQSEQEYIDKVLALDFTQVSEEAMDLLGGRHQFKTTINQNIIELAKAYPPASFKAAKEVCLFHPSL